MLILGLWPALGFRLNYMDILCYEHSMHIV